MMMDTHQDGDDGFIKTVMMELWQDDDDGALVAICGGDHQSTR